ncbi:MAG TPA: vitamin B12 dependent-methionine synthase activation domain-containing protein, partial [Cyclobacteriaceae bacterium]|nr:vitamin B12 dependent-methionine synthase activation domain-containing protein [Cyclobacteriaceae bacterium]
VPFIEKENKGGVSKKAGKILLATVKGDVHDIGKNIVGVVLSCNNFQIIDLGVMTPMEKILKTAEDEKVDIIGLSGLITPSLEEMTYVAKEMERRKLSLPLLIGGATTSRIHTAVRIDPCYQGPVIHVLDASRSVPVASSLISGTVETAREFSEKTKAEYRKLREEHLQRQQVKTLISLDEARNRKYSSNWGEIPIKKPEFLGTKSFRDFPIEDLIPFIDWTPFFIAWEMKGKYPSILDDPGPGKEAQKLFNDAKKLIDTIISRKLLRANAVIGFYPANSDMDDIEVYHYHNSAVNGYEEDRSKALLHLHHLRQQNKKAPDQPNFCLSDFIAPKDSGREDYIGAFVVTAGLGAEEAVKQFENDHDDYSAIMLKALADRFAEAFAEYLHLQVRKKYWAYNPSENLAYEELIREGYSGIRPAPGYPACPDHQEKAILFQLLDAEKNTGITLTESLAMHPAASVSGWYFAHPESKYFGINKIARDQVEDYAKRIGQNLVDTERWLATILGYERT